MAINWKQAISGNWSQGTNWSSNTVPTAADDATIGFAGNYVVGITSADTAKSLTFDGPGAELLESAGGSLNLSGALTVQNGLVVLDAANTIGGGVMLEGGEIAVANGNAGALGSGTLTTTGGELFGTATENIGNVLDIGGAFTLAAARGTTLDAGSNGWVLETGAALTFGAAGQDGTVVWNSIMGGIHSPLDQTVRVQGGTLKAGSVVGLGFLLGNVASTSVDTGAIIDVAGIDTAINDLTGGAGTVTNSSATFATLTLQGTVSTFTGAISGALSVDVKSSVRFLGSNTYTGSTTVENGAAVTLGAGSGSGSLPGGTSVTINAGGVLAFARNNAMTVSGTLFGTGSIAQEASGTTTLTGLNSFGGTIDITAGTLAAANANALGSASVTLNGGELLGTANETLSNMLHLQGVSTIAAAHGTTLDAGSGGWVLDTGTALDFGAAGQDGTVVWHRVASTIGTPVDQAVEVQAGTLKAGDALLGSLLGAIPRTIVDAGAGIDIAGFDTTVGYLVGSGAVANSAGLAILTLNAADFSGKISGVLSLDATGLVNLSGANTYTGNTIIENSGALTLGTGGTIGSIAAASAVTDNGIFGIDRSDAVTLANAISGSGSLQKRGAGTTTIATANTYSGGTSIDAGTLALGNAGGLGGGAVTFNSAELLGTASETIANRLVINGGVIAAAHGTTLDVGSGIWSLGSGAILDFGAPGQDGTVVWHTPAGGTISNGGSQTVEVQGGTLKAGDNNLGFLLSDVAQNIVDAGATIDLAGFGASVANLQGAGTVTNTGAGAAPPTLNLNGADFFGTLSGALRLEVSGSATLAGTSTISGGIFIQGGVLTNAGILDLTSDLGVDGTSSANTITNIGVFEKTAGTGIAIVSTPFENDQQVVATSGSIQFTGGFTNIGIVKGLLSHTGSIWTVTANAPGQTTYFGGSGDNRFVIGSVPTFIDGGPGSDTVELTASMTLAAGSLANVETVQVDNGVTANLSQLTLGESIVLASAAGGGASVTGTQGADTIIGGAGNDILNGGAGADLMTGGAGDDAYFVDNAGDQVVEAAGGGTDRVHAGISYTLTANVENLILDGTANINGTGNTLANSILGNSGANILNGGAGADLMTGGAGDDAYIVDNAGDQVVETAGGGTDRVHAGISYALTANVENLILDGTANINGTGNTLANSIMGNSGNNVLTGGAGSDTFVYSSAAFGKDTLADFTAAGASHDMLSLAHTLFADFNTVLADSAQVGTGTVITYDQNDTITLANTQRSTLTASDFHFT